VTALFTILACALRTVALFVSFDADIGYFHTTAPLVILTDVCTLLSIVLGATIPFLINIEIVPEETSPLSSPRFIGTAVNTLFPCAAALFLIFCVKDVPAPALLVLITALCLLATAAYFLLRLFYAKPKTAASIGFSVILAAATVLATTYFDRYTPMNAPHKLSLHLCMLSIMFAMLYELRALLARPMPRACTAATVIAASLCTVYALSNVIAFVGNVYNDVTYFFFDLLTLGFAIYFIAKCIGLAILSQADHTEVEQ
jgi:hypothetical protein